MVQQLRESIAAKPAGIAMMGHPGEAAIMPLARRPPSRHQDDVPERAAAGGVAKYGGGYVGAQQAAQGKALGGRRSAASA